MALGDRNQAKVYVIDCFSFFKLYVTYYFTTLYCIQLQKYFQPPGHGKHLSYTIDNIYPSVCIIYGYTHQNVNILQLSAPTLLAPPPNWFPRKRPNCHGRLKLCGDVAGVRPSGSCVRHQPELLRPPVASAGV